MGNLTAKTSGELASFMTPSMTNIKSLKVHFSPKQLGTGDPSPENVREIEGWDGVNAYNDPKYSGNIVWNQCFDLSTLKIGSGTSNNFNVTKLDTGFRATTNADVSGSGSRVVYFTVKWNRIQNHRYIFLCKIKGNTLKFSSFYIYHANGSSNRPAQNSTEQYVMTETYTGSTATTNASSRLYIYGIELLEGESFEVTDLMAIDLDMMFGTTVIDNLFNNTTTALQRVDWFTSIITNYDYRDYNEGEITTVSAVNNEPYANLSINWSSNIGTIYGGYVDLISGELVQDMRYKQITADALSNAGDSIGYTSSVTALNGQSAVWIRNLFNSTAKGRKSGGIKANCNAFKVLMNSTEVSSSQNRTAFTVDSSITNVSDFISAVETLEQNGSGLYLAYELATSITHQLTPTQLKSFVGQNNFWSNADYVEIEYDLIETIDIQKAKQKIILNQPQLKTVSDKVVSFNTDMVAPMKSCKIYFNPIQEGTGDPSPTNIRNINGWTGLDSYVNGDKISIDWTNDAGTIYGGYLDLAKGEVVATYALFDAYQNRSLFIQGDGNVYIVNNRFATYGFVKPINTNKSISTHFKAVNITTENYPSFSVSNIGHFALRGIPNVTDTVEHFTTYIEEQMNNNTPVQFVMPLVTPIIYQLTPQQLLTIKGWNNYWSNIDTNLEIKYWSHKIPPSESNIAYVGENLTFDGTVNSVIDTGIYLFNEENINRDFEVVVEGLYGNDKDSGGANTVICAKHNGNAYGFLVRINSNSNATYNGTITVKINYNNTLVIKRVDGVISVNGDSITNPKVKFTNAVHQWSLVLGCAIDDNGTYYRFSKGSIKRIIVRWL